MSQRDVGEVKWFNEKKGFGFIRGETDNDDIFVHYKDIVGTGFKTLHEHEKVSFVLEQGPKGKKAQEVIVIRDQ